MNTIEMVITVLVPLLALIWVVREACRKNTAGVVLAVCVVAGFLVWLHAVKQSRLTIAKVHATAIALESVKQIEQRSADATRDAFESFASDNPMEKNEDEFNFAMAELIRRLSQAEETNQMNRIAQPEN